MKIVINAVGWSNLIKGMDRYCIELIRNLSYIDNQNYYYIFYGKWQKYFVNMINKKNFKFISVSWSSKRVFRHIWHALVFPFLAYKLRPDIIHLPGTMPLVFKSSKTVITIHDGLLEFFYPQKYGFFRSLARRIIVKRETKKSTKIIAVSPSVKTALIERIGIPPEKVIVVLNGVNTDQFSPSLINNLPFDIKKPYILFVSVIDRNKNLEALLKAFYLLQPKLKEKYILIIAGKKGNAYGRIYKLVQNLRLKDKVIFLGHITENLPQLYANATLFVMPSYYEGFSLPVLEAMSSGVPSIISRTIAIADFVKNETILFDPTNVYDLKNKIEHIILNRELAKKIGEKGLKKVKESFSWILTARATLEIYNKISQTKT